MLKMFKSKIHRATITESDLHYEGSCAIDTLLLKASGILPYESIWVWNINTGSRLMTYAISAPEGSGTICLNGSAARLGAAGDLVIITTFADMNEAEAARHQPTVVIVDEKNAIKKVLKDSGHSMEELK